MNDLTGTMFEGSFLDLALRENAQGDRLLDLQDEAFDRWDAGEVGDDGRLIYDRRVWGITWHEWGISTGGWDLLEEIVESYRQEVPLLTIIERVAEHGEPFPEDQARAIEFLSKIDEFGWRERHIKSVEERLDPNSPYFDGPNAPSAN